MAAVTAPRGSRLPVWAVIAAGGVIGGLIGHGVPEPEAEQVHKAVEDGNTLIGRHLGWNTSGTIVRSSEEHLVVTLGLKDCIVVHTPDANGQAVTELVFAFLHDAFRPRLFLDDFYWDDSKRYNYSVGPDGRVLTFLDFGGSELGREVRVDASWLGE